MKGFLSAAYQSSGNRSPCYCAMLCCAVMCCALLRCAFLCCAVLCCTYYAVPCCALLCCAFLRCAVLCLLRCVLIAQCYGSISADDRSGWPMAFTALHTTHNSRTFLLPHLSTFEGHTGRYSLQCLICLFVPLCWCVIHLLCIVLVLISILGLI